MHKFNKVTKTSDILQPVTPCSWLLLYDGATGVSNQCTLFFIIEVLTTWDIFLILIVQSNLINHNLKLASSY